MLKIPFHDNAVKGRKWFFRFKHGETSGEDCVCSGCPSTGYINENLAKFHKIVNEDRQNTISEIAGMLHLSYGTCQQILMEDIQELLDEVRNYQSSLSRVITGDETRVYYHSPETKQQSSPHPREAKQVRLNIKSMLVIFFVCEGVADQECIPPGQTVNLHYYCKVLQRPSEQVC
jgi:hypothetical protein